MTTIALWYLMSNNLSSNTMLKALAVKPLQKTDPVQGDVGKN